MPVQTTMSSPSSNRTTLSLVCLIVFFVGCAIASVAGLGCQKPLFPEKNTRSQFETYDNLRQQNQPLVVPDEFGNPQPALRARLSPST